MDTITACNNALKHKNKPVKIFDWVKAAQLIKEHNASYAAAGLQEDWEWTGGMIYEKNEIVPRENTYTYLSSRWATPQLILDNKQYFECYKYQDEVPNWDSYTYWPQEAIDILNNS